MIGYPPFDNLTRRRNMWDYVPLAHRPGPGGIYGDDPEEDTLPRRQTEGVLQSAADIPPTATLPHDGQQAAAPAIRPRLAAQQAAPPALKPQVPLSPVPTTAQDAPAPDFAAHQPTDNAPTHPLILARQQYVQEHGKRTLKELGRTALMAGLNGERGGLLFGLLRGLVDPQASAGHIFDTTKAPEIANDMALRRSDDLYGLNRDRELAQTQNYRSEIADRDKRVGLLGQEWAGLPGAEGEMLFQKYTGKTQPSGYKRPAVSARTPVKMERWYDESGAPRLVNVNDPTVDLTGLTPATVYEKTDRALTLNEQFQHRDKVANVIKEHQKALGEVKNIGSYIQELQAQLQPKSQITYTQGLPKDATPEQKAANLKAAIATFSDQWRAKKAAYDLATRTLDNNYGDEVVKMVKPESPDYPEYALKPLPETARPRATRPTTKSQSSNRNVTSGKYDPNKFDLTP